MSKACRGSAWHRVLDELLGRYDELADEISRRMHQQLPKYHEMPIESFAQDVLEATQTLIQLASDASPA